MRKRTRVRSDGNQKVVEAAMERIPPGGGRPPLGHAAEHLTTRFSPRGNMSRPEYLMAAEESFGKTRGTRIYRGDVLRLNLGPKHVRGRRRREAGRAEAGVQPRARELPLFRSLLHPWLCPPPLRSTMIARSSQPRGSPKSRGELTAEKLEQDIDMG